MKNCQICVRCGESFLPYIRPKHAAKGHIRFLCLACNRWLTRKQNNAFKKYWANAGDWKKFLTIYKKKMKCASCGYSKHTSALHNHHVNPSTKRFCIHYSDHKHSWEALISELLVTDVLCANCHTLVHHNVIGCPALRAKRIKVIHDALCNLPKVDYNFSSDLRKRLGLSPTEAVAKRISRRKAYYTEDGDDPRGIADLP